MFDTFMILCCVGGGYAGGAAQDPPEGGEGPAGQAHWGGGISRVCMSHVYCEVWVEKKTQK